MYRPGPIEMATARPSAIQVPLVPTQRGALRSAVVPEAGLAVASSALMSGSL
jgi:hypothetical protein